MFASAGGDRTVRIWTPTKMVAISEQLAKDPTALDWSSNGKFIVAGNRAGSCQILDANTLTVIDECLGKLAGQKESWV
jgi:WD40 repeat protein